MRTLLLAVALLSLTALLPAQPLDISVRLNKPPEQAYREGEKILITFDASQTCYVHVVYQDASGERFLIFPNDASDPEGKVRGNQRVTIGRGVNIDGFAFEVIPPFGGELIRAYASTKPLQPPDGETLDGGMVLLKSPIDELDVYYHEQARSIGSEFTNATVLLKTAARDERSDRAKDERSGEEVAAPRMFGLVIGVSKYAHEDIKSLRYADADARIMAEFLQSPSGGSIPDERLRMLLNEDATRDNILDAFSSFLGQTRRDDIVIIHIIGHGLVAPRHNATYFLSYDSDPGDLPATAVDHADLTGLLTERVKAGKIILFSDACHGGGIGLTGVKFRGAHSDISGKLLTELVTKKNGTVFFTASRAMERSQESTRWGGGHGAFTWYLVQGLMRLGDQNKDGKVAISELADFVIDKVRDDTKGEQHPELKGYFDNDLVLSVLK